MTPSSVSSSSSVAPALPAGQSAAIESALTSSDPATVAKVLAPEVRAGYASGAFRLLPPGSTVTIDATGLTSDGDVATVPATVVGGPAAGHWLLLLEKVNGTWLLYGTSKA